MRPLISTPLLLLLGGCASVPACPDYGREEKKAILRDPARIHAYFLDHVRCGELAAAHDILSRGAKERVPYEAFYLAIRNQSAPELTQRVLLGFEQHGVSVAEDGKSATVRWCNREFGISRDYRLLSEFGGRLWAIDFTREQLEELVPAAFAWFRRQREAAGGRIYAYPPDWTYARVSDACPCGN